MYGQNTINNNTIVDTNGSINYRDVTNSTKVFEPTANPTVGAIITFTNPTSEPQDNNSVTNANGSGNYSLPSSLPSEYTNSTENMTGVQEGDGQEIDTGDEVGHALTISQAQAINANLVVPDSSPFKSNQCTPVGSLEKFVPNPFMKDLGTTRFIVGNCITVSGEVTWTHYINTDGDANFNIKLDKKYNLFSVKEI